MMDTVTISPKFQIVIPQRIRERMGLVPGQKLRAMLWGDTLTYVPQLPIDEVRKHFAGLVNDFQRETDREVY
ncbi:AbrB/MazE/SpoVT family DNA-binding domain-containing protein [Sandarakinorhabdus sp.]|uniref:AbrB/MazE/SpoVT family DNA-binding domain-containing protein n=1 Tax=Sandarakinorhabdus sp. TaxID=1916663 RepID=UPI00286EA1E5|nr:AbrB/MazE/SpoVT family DNA-binding domain-containing protein [Sandarakinorhabdus sp.]